jgi:hypothetical protein
MNIEIGGFFGFIVLVLDLWAVVNIFGSHRGTGAKVLWLLLIILLPFLGWLIWLLAGPRSERR